MNQVKRAARKRYILKTKGKEAMLLADNRNFGHRRTLTYEQKADTESIRKVRESRMRTFLRGLVNKVAERSGIKEENRRKAL